MGGTGGELRAAVIGLGVGTHHIRGYEAHAQCRTVAVCDLDESRLVAHADYQTTTNAGEILADADIDVVSIATYDDSHAALVCEALRQDKHVFCEKPLCLCPQEARQIRALLNERPHLQLSSNLILRRCPRFREVRQRIRNGEFGTVFHLEADYLYGRLHKLTEGWRGELDFYSIVYGGGVHMVDLLMWLHGSRVERVSACGNRLATAESRFRFNDMVTATLQFESGATGKVSANSACRHPHFHAVNVFGTDLTFVNGLEHGLMYRSLDHDDPPEVMQAAYPGYMKGDLITHFIDMILNPELEPEVMADDAFDAMSVCFAIEEAVASGQTTEVEYL